jgi:GntR family transcriptional repressor for pyruvate dehydrogenase complex
MEIGEARGAVDGVVDQLREQILTGSLRSGTLLPAERDLAVRLDVSRPTLRQALSILAQMGLVTTQRGRKGGTVVTTPSTATVASTVTLLFQTRTITAAHLTEVRRGLEVEAVQLAAARRSDQDQDAIAEAFARYVASEQDPDAHNRLGRAFHYALARASANPLLVEMMYSLNEAFAECFGWLVNIAELRRAADEIHRPIVEAVERGDADEARWAMIRHFEQLDRVLGELGIDDRPLDGWAQDGGYRAAHEPRAEILSAALTRSLDTRR